MFTSIKLLKVFLICASFSKLTNAEYNCTAAGKFSDPEDEMKYHECHLVGENKYSHFSQICPIDTCFDGADRTCNPEHCMSEMQGNGTGMPPEEQAAFFNCPAPGKFSHVDPTRRDAYYKCIDANGVLYLYEYQCRPIKPCFSAAKQACYVC